MRRGIFCRRFLCSIAADFLWKQYRCNEQACSQSKSGTDRHTNSGTGRDADAYAFRRRNRFE
jgi:hypothetical protein